MLKDCSPVLNLKKKIIIHALHTLPYLKVQYLPKVLLKLKRSELHKLICEKASYCTTHLCEKIFLNTIPVLYTYIPIILYPKNILYVLIEDACIAV